MQLSPDLIFAVPEWATLAAAAKILVDVALLKRDLRNRVARLEIQSADHNVQLQQIRAMINGEKSNDCSRIVT